MVSVFEGCAEVGGEWDVEGVQLRREAGEVIAFGGLGVVDGGLVGEEMEVAGGDEAVAAVVAGPASDEEAGMGAGGVGFVDWVWES